MGGECPEAPAVELSSANESIESRLHCRLVAVLHAIAIRLQSRNIWSIRLRIQCLHAHKHWIALLLLAQVVHVKPVLVVIVNTM